MSASYTKNAILLWILAIILTLSSVVYQRLTGPTHPIRGSIEIDGETVQFKLLRTHDSTDDAKMELHIPSAQITGELHWRRYLSLDTWSTKALERKDNNLIIAIPKQPAAGKVMYRISLIDSKDKKHYLTDESVIIRFKDPVPLVFLMPHIIFMFAGMLLAVRTGFEAITRGDKAFKLSLLTAILLILGGLVFGPIVQKYAFGEFWTGWPFGHDMTDTKTAAVLILWLIALWRTRAAGKGRVWIIVAAATTLLIYLLPHSMMGSEIDYTKTK
ncbi:MAG: hypothetical protein J7K40_09790 [candidate division Zixibacteria bacterium]|nr:hypothetical protein [candidate division Zixibacteria bacterium]